MMEHDIWDLRIFVEILKNKTETQTLTDGVGYNICHSKRHTVICQVICLLVQFHLSTPALHTVGFCLEKLQEPVPIPLTN